MPASSPLAGVQGNPAHIRIGPSSLTRFPGSCSAHVAFKARPDLRASVKQPGRDSTRETFALGPVQAAIDQLEFGPDDPDERQSARRDQSSPHPGLLRFTDHAVAQYQPHHHTLADPGLHPVRGHWVVRKRSERAALWEVFHWGRLYESADLTVREFRFLRIGQADADRRSPAEVALAAYVTAFGRLASRPQPWEWNKPFHITGCESQAERIRIAEIGLLDGSRIELFDGTPDEARTLYTDHAHSLVREVANTLTPTPGADCVGCKGFASCEAAPRVPGVLGLPRGEHRPRKLSASQLRYIGTCPAQAHLRELHLPKEHEYTPANIRGQAVHDWLAARHSRANPIPCPESPPAEDWWRSTRHTLTPEQAHLGAQMIAHHAQVCPHHLAADHLRAEPPLTFVDTHVNAVVLATPDLLYEDEGALVWRETKTLLGTGAAIADPLKRYPQLALATVLLAEGAVDDNNPRTSRVELELLTPAGADVLTLTAADIDVVTRARQVLGELAWNWHTEQSFAPRPGPHCARCPVARWCPDQEETT